MKMLQRALLDKQVEENKQRKAKEYEIKERDEWNTIEQQGYNDEVLARHPSYVNTSQPSLLNEDKVVKAPEWNDPAIKYLSNNKPKSKGKLDKASTNQGSQVIKKHFLYPLLNESKRKRFK